MLDVLIGCDIVYLQIIIHIGGVKGCKREK